METAETKKITEAAGAGEAKGENGHVAGTAGMNDMEIKTVHLGEPSYPPLLKEIKDPPKILYYIGNLALAESRCIAVVGTRRATPYGLWAARELGKILGKSGAVTVSGMARGIDTNAHLGALEQGTTIAVLGCGIDCCYPPSNRKLRNDIARKGLILSEYPPGMPPAKYTFPRRNRIISGLSEAVAVVQAGNSSGALITAELAGEQGRTVYSVPGNINSSVSLGSNKLLKDGAVPLVILEDILDDLGIPRTAGAQTNPDLGKAEWEIYRLLQRGGEYTADRLCRETGRPASQISGLVTVLEMKGLLFTSLGKIFIAK